MSEQIKAIRFHEYGGSEKLVLETIPRSLCKGSTIQVLSALCSNCEPVNAEAKCP